MVRGVLALIVLVAAATPSLSAESGETALFSDGRRAAGQLTVNSEGRLQFNSADTRTSEKPHLIQFTPQRSAEFERPCQRFWLGDAQRFSALLSQLDDKAVVVDWGTKDRRTFPRGELRALALAVPYTMHFADDFETAPKAWRFSGGAARSKEQAASGAWSLKLSGAGAAAELTLPTNLTEGRLETRIRTHENPAGAAWLLQATLGDGKSEKTVRILLAGSSDAADVIDATSRSAGWHSLALRFHPTYVLVGFDQKVRWSSTERDLGPLRKLSLVCQGSADEVQGAVFFDDLTIAQIAPIFRPTDRIQARDSLCLRAGDQLFGTLAKADPETIEFRGRFEGSRFSWAEVWGIDLHAPAAPVHRSTGQHARVRFLSTLASSEADEVVGVIQAIDARSMTLEHPVLGKIMVERRRLLSIQPLFFGTRIELGHEVCVLGEAGSKVTDVPGAVAKPALTKSFKVDVAPKQVTLALEVAPLSNNESEGRTDVLVNGARVETLERHLRGRSHDLRPLRIALPADAVRVGDNMLELRQAGKATNCCMVRDILLELSN